MLESRAVAIPNANFSVKGSRQSQRKVLLVKLYLYNTFATSATSLGSSYTNIKKPSILTPLASIASVARQHVASSRGSTTVPSGWLPTDYDIFKPPAQIPEPLYLPKLYASQQHYGRKHIFNKSSRLFMFCLFKCLV